MTETATAQDFVEDFVHAVGSSNMNAMLLAVDERVAAGFDSEARFVDHSLDRKPGSRGHLDRINGTLEPTHEANLSVELAWCLCLLVHYFAYLLGGTAASRNSQSLRYFA